jgi:MFS family permease
MIFGPIGVLLAIVLSQSLREPQRGASEDTANASPAEAQAWGASLGVLQTLRVIFRTPAALLLMGAFLCANFVAVIFLTWTPAFLVDKFHYKIGAAGLTGTIFIHLASAIAVPLAGGLADRLVRRFTTGRMALQCAGLIVGSVFVFMVAMTGSTTILVITMACFGACKGFYDSGIFASLYDVIEPRARGTAAGLINTVGWGAGALGPLAVGWLSKHGRHAAEIDNMSEAIALCSVVYIVGAALVLCAMFFAKKQLSRKP